MTPKLIFATLGIVAAVASLVFTHPFILAAGVISLGVAVILPPNS